MAFPAIWKPDQDVSLGEATSATYYLEIEGDDDIRLSGLNRGQVFAR